jgi:hypothetical protein
VEAFLFVVEVYWLAEVGFAGVVGDVFCGDVDVEAGEEVGDLVVGEAALSEETNLFGEHSDHLRGGEALLFGAGGLAEFDGGAGYLVDGVGAI